MMEKKSVANGGGTAPISSRTITTFRSASSALSAISARKSSQEALLVGGLGRCSLGMKSNWRDNHLPKDMYHSVGCEPTDFAAIMSLKANVYPWSENSAMS